jgi:hypothetical protein
VVEVKVIGYQRQQLRNLAQEFQSDSQVLMGKEGIVLWEVRKLDPVDELP